MRLNDKFSSKIQLTEDGDDQESYLSAMDEMPLNIQDIWTSMDNTRDLTDELPSCTYGKRLTGC